jgi:hypothetical protein
MAHQIPTELGGEETLFVLPWVNMPVKKRSGMYCAGASAIAYFINKITGNWVAFGVVFFALNVYAIRLGQTRVSVNKFDCGNMPYDKYLLRKYKYKYFGKNIYTRTRIKEDLE